MCSWRRISVDLVEKCKDPLGASARDHCSCSCTDRMKCACSSYLHLQPGGLCLHANDMNWVACQMSPVQTWLFNRKPKLCLFGVSKSVFVTLSRSTTLKEEAGEVLQVPVSNGRIPTAVPILLRSNNVIWKGDPSSQVGHVLTKGSFVFLLVIDLEVVWDSILVYEMQEEVSWSHSVKFSPFESWMRNQSFYLLLNVSMGPIARIVLEATLGLWG